MRPAFSNCTKQGEDPMESWMTVVIAALVVLAVTAWFIHDRQRSKRLRERFGLAYDQTVSEVGNRRRAEAQLESRAARANELRARPMGSADRARFSSQWKQCQALFVDDPAGAVAEADKLLVEVMRTRGFAADNFNERVTDIAAAYPQQADRYRQAGEIVELDHRSAVTTDKLRTAFLNYREVFDDLIGEDDETLRRAA
jgi:hypothetical protein